MLAYSITTLFVTLYKLLTMSAHGWIFPLALCFICVSSNDEHKNTCEETSEFCSMSRISAALGSSVLLPCNFSRSNANVSWAHNPMAVVVHLTSKGRIEFLDPRFGRVKAFPNQCSEGNYSIRIDELKNSDMGCYRCRQGRECLEVELVAETGTESKVMSLLIFIVVGIAAVILLIVCSFSCMKCILYIYHRTQDNMNNPVGAGTEGGSCPPEETGRAPVGEQQRGADNLVYENDDQDPGIQLGYPTRNHRGPPGVVQHPATTQPTQSTIYPHVNQSNFEKVESQRTKLRFHTELFSRIRQASLSRHYYVNRGELSRQQAMSTQAETHRRVGLGKKKAKEIFLPEHEYKNPIYNSGMERLNRL